MATESEKLLDCRCRHKVQYKQDFYLYIKYPRNHIFYVQFRPADGGKVTVSTRQTSVIKAHDFALRYWDEHFGNKRTVETNPGKTDNNTMLVHRKSKARKKEEDVFHRILAEFYDVKTELGQEVARNVYGGVDKLPRTHSEKVFRCKIVGDFFPKVKRFEDLKSADVLRFRAEMLNRKVYKRNRTYSTKAIVNMTTALSQIYDYLNKYKSMRLETPCVGLKDVVSNTKDKKQREAFPLDKVGGRMTLAKDNPKLSCAMFALLTGLRNGEIARVSESDIIEWQGMLWLNVHGTKTENAERQIPLHRLAAAIIRNGLLETSRMVEGKTRKTNGYYFTSVLNEFCKYVDCYKGVHGEKLHFYSLRHTFDYRLTNEMVSDNFTEYLMGHVNSQTNDVRKSYGIVHFDYKNGRTMYDTTIRCVNFFVDDEWKDSIDTPIERIKKDIDAIESGFYKCLETQLAARTASGHVEIVSGRHPRRAEFEEAVIGLKKWVRTQEDYYQNSGIPDYVQKDFTLRKLELLREFGSMIEYKNPYSGDTEEQS